MLASALLSLLAVSSPLAVQACQSHITKPPLLWLADVRANAPPGTDSTTTLNKADPGMRLIRFEQGAVPIPITADEHLELQKSGLRYTDVTEVDLEAVVTAKAAEGNYASNGRASKPSISYKTLFFGYSYSHLVPTAPSKQAQVRPVLATLSQANLKTDLTKLTSYKNRYYKSATGAQSAKDLLAKLQAIAASSSGGGRVTVSAFSHTWGMSSIIARIEGNVPRSTRWTID